MSELLQEALRLYNFPITVCFGLVLIFWGMTIVGVVDTDALEPDLDLDLDTEVAVDGDVDVDTHADAHSGSFGLGLLRFFNLGDVPIVVLLSVLIALVWAGSIVGNYRLNPEGSYLIAGGIFLGNFIVSLFLTKLVTTPLKPLMRALKAGEKHRPVIGRTCVVKTSEVTESFGQAEAEDDTGNPLLLHVRVSPGQPPLSKGDQALVVDTLDDARTYIVRKLKS